MKSSKFDLKTADGVCDCYAVSPDDGQKHPGVLVFMDAFGPRKYMYELCGSIASHGYHVLLPNLFYRLKRGPVVEANYPLNKETVGEAFKQITALFANHNPDKNVEDAKYFIEYFRSQPDVKLPIGITGYCMGGSLALKTAAAFPKDVAAVASFHAGRLVSDAPNSVHRQVDKIRACMYIAHADKDESMPQDAIERFDQALREAGSKAKTEVMKGAAHGFTMRDLPAYNEGALKHHWEKLTNLFAETLK